MSNICVISGRISDYGPKLRYLESGKPELAFQAWAAIQKAAAILREQSPQLTPTDAVCQVVARDPELYAAWKAAR
jgi:hypothetical protein